MDYAYFIILFVMVLLNIAMVGFRVPLMGFVVGIISLCIVAVAAGQADNIPYYPLPNALLGLIAVVGLFSSGVQFKRGG